MFLYNNFQKISGRCLMVRRWTSDPEELPTQHAGSNPVARSKDKRWQESYII